MTINFNSIIDKYQGVLLDAYGVFWGGNATGPFPNAMITMEKMVSSGKIVGILSNSTQLSGKEKDKLKKAGLLEGVHYHFYVTSGDIAKEYLIKKDFPFETPNKKYFVFLGNHPKYSSHLPLFENSPFQETSKIEEADFIFVGIPHIKGEDQTEGTLFQEEIEKLIKYQKPMLCINPDTHAHEGNPPRAVLRQGYIAVRYKALGGIVYYIGKPSSHAFEFALDIFKTYGIQQKQIVMVGDTPETDIRGANNVGLSSILITDTGIMAERIKKESSALKNLKKEDQPRFLISRL